MMPKTMPKVFDLNLYLKSIDAYPLLSLGQEVEIARRVQKGDPEARELMISSNLRLVVNIARQYMGQGHHRRNLADIIEEGNLGLIQAVGRFQPERYNTRFSTYAAWWIKQSIRNSLRNGNWPMRIPAYMHTLLAALRKEGVTEPAHLDTPEGLEVLKKVRGARGNWKKTVDQVKRAMSAASMGMIEAANNDDSNEFLLEKDNNAHEAADIHINRETIEVLLSAVEENLDERERAVVKARFGIGCPSQTLRVRQIETQAMTKLKERCLVAGEDDSDE
jgi:RNA polymerase sigma factor (sigma-70 family)